MKSLSMNVSLERIVEPSKIPETTQFPFRESSIGKQTSQSNFPETLRGTQFPGRQHQPVILPYLSKEKSKELGDRLSNDLRILKKAKQAMKLQMIVAEAANKEDNTSHEHESYWDAKSKSAPRRTKPNVLGDPKRASIGSANRGFLVPMVQKGNHHKRKAPSLSVTCAESIRDLSHSIDASQKEQLGILNLNPKQEKSILKRKLEVANFPQNKARIPITDSSWEFPSFFSFFFGNLRNKKSKENLKKWKGESKTLTERRHSKYRGKLKELQPVAGSLTWKPTRPGYPSIRLQMGTAKSTWSCLPEFGGLWMKKSLGRKQ